MAGNAMGDAEAARANLYYVLSRAFSSPAEMSSEDVDRLRELLPCIQGRLHDAARLLAEVWARSLTQRDDLLRAYARLFLGPFEILAPPYASFYLEPDHQLMGPVSRNVAEMYATAGLEPGPGPREAPDHAALEWEFMYFMTHQFLATGNDEWLRRRDTFLKTHLRNWMPAFAGAIARAKSHGFYDALSSLLTMLHEDAWLLGSPRS